MDKLLQVLAKGPPPMVYESVDKTLTTNGILFASIVAVLTVLFLFIYAQYQRRWQAHYAVAMLGVFIFEAFTSPMWGNPHFGAYGYIFRDVSWILTFGWTTLILAAKLIVDELFPSMYEWKRFILSVLLFAVFGFFGEMLVLGLGMRWYSPEVKAVLSGITVLGTPIDTLYYVPVFGALILGFYQYWGYILDGVPLLPVHRGGYVRRFLITTGAVFLFEVMIEPMVINANFPSWSYVFHDISFILTFGWVILVWCAIWIVEKLWATFNMTEKFILYSALVGMLALPAEALLIKYGYRVYEGTTAGNAFSGFSVPVLNVPVEVAIAIPMYFALVIGFVATWDIMLTNAPTLRATPAPAGSAV